jgi:hypothetical protein
MGSLEIDATGSNDEVKRSRSSLVVEVHDDKYMANVTVAIYFLLHVSIRMMIQHFPF